MRGVNTSPLHKRLLNPIWLRWPFLLALKGFIRYFIIPLEQIKIGSDFVFYSERATHPGDFLHRDREEGKLQGKKHLYLLNQVLDKIFGLSY